MARSFLPNGLCPWPTPSSGPLPFSFDFRASSRAAITGLVGLQKETSLDELGLPRRPSPSGRGCLRLAAPPPPQPVQGPAKGLQLSQLPDPQLRSELRDHDREEVAGRHWRRRSPLAARCSAPPSRASQRSHLLQKTSRQPAWAEYSRSCSCRSRDEEASRKDESDEDSSSPRATFTPAHEGPSVSTAAPVAGPAPPFLLLFLFLSPHTLVRGPGLLRAL